MTEHVRPESASGADGPSSADESALSEPVAVRPGPTNSLHDVAGLSVGHETLRGDGWLTGTTVVLAPEEGVVAGVDVRGGGPGTRETDLLDPRNVVERVHAICLCGGSAFGLAAADGVMRALFDDGIGLPPACLVAPPSPAHPAGEPLPEGGFGWLIIHGLTRSLVYFREDTRNLLAFNIPAMDEAEG